MLPVPLLDGSLELRVPTITDARPMAELGNDKRIWDNLRNLFPHPYRLEHAKEFIALVQEENPARTLAICIEGSFAGIIGLNLQPDVYEKSLEIGYWLGAPFWGQGLASRAVKLMSGYAFEYLDCNRLHTGVYSYNPASMRVLEKCGYQKEGVFKNAIWKNQEFWDEHRYALLKNP